MSKSAFRKEVSKVLLENFNRKSEKLVAEAARILLQSAAVQQCIVLKTTQTHAIQAGFEEGIAPAKLTSAQKTRYRKELKQYIRGLSQPFPEKQPGAVYFKQLVKRNKLTFGRSIFYVPLTFEGIKEKIHDFNESFLKRLKKPEATYNKDAAGSTTHLDHGADGTASGLVGAATGSIQVARRQGKEIDEKVFEDNLRLVLGQGIKSLAGKRIAAPLMKVLVEAKQQVTEKGDLEAGLSMILTPVLAGVNLGSAAEEKAIQEAFLQAVEMTITGQKYIDLEGSSSLKQKLDALYTLNVTNRLKNKKNVQIKNASPVKLKTTTKVEEKGKQGKQHNVKAPRVRGRAAKRRQSTKGAQGNSMFSMVALINQKLPQTVRKNMREPALVNRSGRFAESVKVTDVTQTRQGFPSLGYQYATRPYQVFEMGRGSPPWATPDRDPRRLIEGSIREVAATLAMGRFYTRRL